VTGVIFEDESIAGDSKRFDDIVQVRDAKSAEITRWCADVKRLSDGPVTKAIVDEILAGHAATPTPAKPVPGLGATEAERTEILSLLRQGLRWQGDGTATVQPLILDILKGMCANAKRHLGKRGIQ
jgi:hypothetical protein